MGPAADVGTPGDLPACWLPVPDHAGSRAPQDVRICMAADMISVQPAFTHIRRIRRECALRSSRGLTPAANGVLASVRRHGGQVTWNWTEQAPIATYLVQIAVGRFTVISHRGPGSLPPRDVVPAGAVRAAAERMAPLRRTLLTLADLGACRLATSGAAPIDPEVFEFFQALGLPMAEAWGMTELTGRRHPQPPRPGAQRHCRHRLPRRRAAATWGRWTLAATCGSWITRRS